MKKKTKKAAKPRPKAKAPKPAMAWCVVNSKDPEIQLWWCTDSRESAGPKKSWVKNGTVIRVEIRPVARRARR